MNVQFRPRGEGWRGKGRPPAACPPALLDIIRQAVELCQDAVIPATGTTSSERRTVVKLLKRGAAQLGVTIRAQHDDSEIRFYVEKSDA